MTTSRCCIKLLVAALTFHIHTSYSVRDPDVRKNTLSAGFLATRFDGRQSPGNASVVKTWMEGKIGTSLDPFPIADKPLGDPRKYQGAVLANGLQVINIQDESSLQSGLAMGVLSGLYNDPPKIAGLAHFCEHMLFLGSKKYPSATEFDQFLSRNGGSNNAFTDSELTDYFFSASSSAAIEAMPRFADWFSEPLFNRMYVNKEVHAIDSEHEKNVQDPTWRVLDTFHSLANPDSPASRFHTGNTDTLLTDAKKNGIDTVSALRKYFNDHYCAPKMRLVTFGPTALSEQFAAAKAAFSNISTGSEACRKPKSWALPEAWPPARLGKWVNILGTQPTAELWLMFPMPDLTATYASQPVRYLDYVFKYAGMNSLAKVLDDSLGLVSSLDYSTETSSAGGSFYLILQLTHAGRKHHSLVLDLVFSYIATLRRDGVNKHLYESLKDLSKLQWDWAGLPSAVDTVQAFAQAMAEMPMEDVIWGGARIDAVNVSLVTSLLEKLRPDNMILASVTPPDDAAALFHNQHLQTLPHYGVNYSVQPLETVLPGRAAKWKAWISGHTPAAQVQLDINDTLTSANMTPLAKLPAPPGQIIGVPKHLPLENMHAEKLTGKKGVGVTESLFGPLPTRLLANSNKSQEMWHRKGWMTNSPQVKVSTALRTLHHENDVEASAQESVEYSLYSTLLGKDIQPRLVDLTATGVGFSLGAGHDGLTLTFDGFMPNMKLLIGMVLQGYKNFTSHASTLTPMASFTRAKDEYRESLQTYSEMPVTYAIKDRSMLIESDSHSDEELLAALENVTLESALARGNHVTLGKPLVLTALSMGNLKEAEAEDIVDTIKKGVPGAAAACAAAEKDSAQVQRVSPVVKPARPVELRKKNPREGDPNDAVVVSVLYGVSTPQSRVKWGILSSILSNIAYEELRTQRQLGYVVNAGVLQLSNVQGVSCVVQGTKLKADQLEAAVESVYQKFMPEKLANLTDEEFKEHAASFRQSLLLPPKSYGEEFGQYWGPVISSSGGTCFHLQDEMLRYLNESLVSKQPLIDEWTALMDPSAGTRKKIVVKYFADAVPPRPSLSEAKATWASQGVPEASIQLLQREHEATVMVNKADSATRAQLRKDGGEYPKDLHCELPSVSALQSFSIRIRLGGLCMLFVLAFAWM